MKTGTAVASRPTVMTEAIRNSEKKNCDKIHSDGDQKAYCICAVIEHTFGHIWSANLHKWLSHSRATTVNFHKSAKCEIHLDFFGFIHVRKQFSSENTIFT